MEVHSGARLQQKFVKRRSFKTVSNAPRAHQKTHPQPLLSWHPAVPRLQNIKTVKTFLLHLCNAILTSTLALARNALIGVFVGLIQTGRWKVGLMNYDELIPSCSLHHFNLSGIDISLLNNKASKQVLPVHSTCTANPLEVSNLRFQCCARVRGENARLDPRYHIWTPWGCQAKAGNCAQWYEPRSPLWLPALPLMWRARPSAPRKKGICDAEKTHLARNKKSNLHQWLTRFQVATERLQELVRNKWTCWKQI